MTNPIEMAFQNTHRGFSTDRVLADPDLNANFITACRTHGLDDTTENLNRKLINLRKSGRLGGQTAKRTQFDDDEYRFAAEIATRHLERRDQITLDDILVNPDLANEFDEICRNFAPGYSSLRYRWSALSLRKSRNLRPEIINQAIPSKEVTLLKADQVNLDEISRSSGIYCFIAEQETLYIGEAGCLRTRLKKHLEHSDNKFLARWIWQHGMDSLTIELHVFPDDVKTKVRKALETEMIRSRRPSFNILGKLYD